MAIIDTHIHLTDSRLWAKLDSEIKEMQKHGITHFLNAGFNKEDWMRQLELKEKSPITFTNSFGLHPYWIHNNLSNEELLIEEWEYLKNNLSNFDAIGETGLDLRNNFKNSYELQQKYFRNHLELHFSCNKVLILHVVRAANPCLEILKSYDKTSSGIVHSFSGSLETAMEFIRLGFYISFSGSVCNAKAKNIQKAASKIPVDHLLIETDSPDQKPPEFSEELNHSWSINLVAKKIAELRKDNFSAEDIIEISNQNFQKLFKYR